MRGWRDQVDGAGAGRPSRPNWDDQRPISRPVSRPNDPSRSRSGSGTNWNNPNQSMPRRPGDPNQSYPRRGDPNASMPRRGDPGASYARRGYDDGYGDADERGLMLAPDAGAIMPQLDDRALPALPTEEEERALGIRRPAFIPATDERTGKKPGRWRVISGVLSIMLFCMAACGVSGVLVQRNVFPGLSQIFGFAPPKSVTTPPQTLPAMYAGLTPLVTPIPGAKTPIQSANSYGSTVPGKTPSDPVTPRYPTDVFAVNNYVYVIIEAGDQVKAKDVISIHWFFDGLDQTTEIQKNAADCCSVHVKDDGKPLQGNFKFSSPTVGDGRADIYYNTTLAYRILFYIGVPSQLTPTPKPTSTPGAQTTPTPVATKHP